MFAVSGSSVPQEPLHFAENWQIIGPSATVLQAAAWEEKVQKAYFETFTIIQTLLFLPGMLD